jgi:hypothetical protein
VDWQEIERHMAIMTKGRRRPVSVAFRAKRNRQMSQDLQVASQRVAASGDGQRMDGPFTSQAVKPRSPGRADVHGAPSGVAARDEEALKTIDNANAAFEDCAKGRR